MKRRNLVAWMLFCAAAVLFAAQTLQAFGMVDLHAEFFAKKGTVVIDPGHGGEDGGSVGAGGELEKDLNLAIALELKKDLERHFFDVVLIRDGDYSVGDQSLSTVAQRKKSDIRKRVEAVENAGECILISIHQNHFSDGRYSGAQMFYSPVDPESARLAESIRQNVVAQLQPENHRECKEAGNDIFLLSHVHVPAVLVECGFLSNAEETRKLCTPEYQKAMAAAIYNGLIDYLQESSAAE